MQLDMAPVNREGVQSRMIWSTYSSMEQVTVSSDRDKTTTIMPSL